MLQTHKPAASRECECVCERGKVSEPSNLFSCTSDFYFTLLLLFFYFSSQAYHTAVTGTRSLQGYLETLLLPPLLSQTKAKQD